MSIARGLIKREFPNMTEIELDKQADSIQQLDEQLELIYEGMIGQIYMYGSKIVDDPGKESRSLFANASDVARLFLAKGLKTDDGTVIPYDERNPVIMGALAHLADEVKVIFYPRMVAFEQVSDHFEKQKAIILLFLKENSEPFPEGKFFSELIARQYNENILPLEPMDAYGEPLPDFLAVMNRNAFDKLRKLLTHFIEAIDSNVDIEPAPRTNNTKPTNANAASVAKNPVDNGPTG